MPYHGKRVVDLSKIRSAEKLNSPKKDETIDKNVRVEKMNTNYSAVRLHDRQNVNLQIKKTDSRLEMADVTCQSPNHSSSTK